MSNHFSLSRFVAEVKSASLTKRCEAKVDYTKSNYTLAKLLLNKGVISSYAIYSCKLTLRTTISLRMKRLKSSPLLKDITVVSRPGWRVYKPIDYLAKIKGGKTLRGFWVFSTDRGVFSSTDLALLLVSSRGSGGRLSGGEVLIFIQL